MKKLNIIINIFKLKFETLSKNSVRLINFINQYFVNLPKKKKYLLIDYFESYEATIVRSYFINIFCQKYNCSPIVFSDKKNILFNKNWREIFKSLGTTNFISIN